MNEEPRRFTNCCWTKRASKHWYKTLKLTGFSPIRDFLSRASVSRTSPLEIPSSVSMETGISVAPGVVLGHSSSTDCCFVEDCRLEIGVAMDLGGVTASCW